MAIFAPVEPLASILSPSLHLELPRVGDGAAAVAAGSNAVTGLYRPAESGAAALLFSSNPADENGIPAGATWGTVQFQVSPAVLSSLDNPNNVLLVSDLVGVRLDAADVTITAAAGTNGTLLNHQATITAPVDILLQMKALSNSSNGTSSVEQPRALATASFYTGVPPATNITLGNADSNAAGIVLTSGNAVIPDVELPTATAQTTLVGSQINNTPINYTIRYEDVSNLIDFTTVSASNITVTDSGGNPVTVTIPTPPVANASPLDVTYQFTPNASETWTIALAAQVKDTSGNTVQSQASLATFTSAGDAEIPTASVPTPLVGPQALNQAISFTVRYEDVSNLVDFSTVAASNITVSGAGSPAVTIPTPPVANATPLDVTYEFTPAVAGSYTIALNSEVKDTTANVVAANGSFATFEVSNVFSFTIQTTTPSETFTLPTGASAAYSFNSTVDWGDGSESTITAFNDADITHTYAVAGNYQIRLGGTFERFTFDNAGDVAKLISLDGNTGGVGLTLFNVYGATNMTSVDSTILDGETSLTTLLNAFRNCSGLTGVFPLIDTSSVVTFDRTWAGANGLSSTALMDFSSGTNFSGTFEGCTGLTSIPAYDFSSAVLMTATWFFCTSLGSFPSTITFPVATNFTLTWANCTSFTAFPSTVGIAAGTVFNQTWANCTGLLSFPLIDMSSGINFSRCWDNCPNMASFSAINTSNGTNFTETWEGCTSLATLPALDLSSAAVLTDFLNNCTAMTSILAIGMAVDVDLTDTNLAAAALDVVYTNLATATATITVTGNPGSGAGDDPSIATGKGWTHVP